MARGLLRQFKLVIDYTAADGSLTTGFYENMLRVGGTSPGMVKALIGKVREYLPDFSFEPPPFPAGDGTE